MASPVVRAGLPYRVPHFMVFSVVHGPVSQFWLRFAFCYLLSAVFRFLPLFSPPSTPLLFLFLYSFPSFSEPSLLGKPFREVDRHLTAMVGSPNSGAHFVVRRAGDPQANWTPGEAKKKQGRPLLSLQ